MKSVIPILMIGLLSSVAKADDKRALLVDKMMKAAHTGEEEAPWKSRTKFIIIYPTEAKCNAARDKYAERTPFLFTDTECVNLKGDSE